MTLRRQSWVRSVLACGALIVPAIGCSDDNAESDNAQTADSGTSGTGGKANSAGKGGSGAKGGAGGTGVTGGTDGNSSGGSIICGGEACTPNSVVVMINAKITACCTEDDKCGQTNTAGDCKEQLAPGTPDETCPTVHVDFMGMDYPQDGCCTPKGQCGGNFEQVGYGCLPREELQSDQGGPLDAISCGSGAAGGSGGSGSSGSGGAGGGSSGAGGSSGNDSDAGADDTDAGN